MFRLNVFLKLWFLGKYLRMSLKNYLPMFVLIFKLKGGLNQITFLFRFHLVLLAGFSNFNVVWYPLFLKAVSYVILLALLNSVSSRDKFEWLCWSLMAIAWQLTVGDWNLNVCIEVCYSVSWKESIFLYLTWRKHLKILSPWDSY